MIRAESDPPAKFRLPSLPWRFAIIVLILWSRRPDALFRAQFWAEDATVFFKQAFEQPHIDSLLLPYNGYLHLVPRSIALAVVKIAPPEHAPLLFNLAAIIIAAASVSLFSSVRFRHVVRSDFARFAACLTIAAAHPAIEIVNMLTNVHWYLTLASLLLIVMPVFSIWEAVAAILIQAIIGFSCPMTLMIVPLALGAAIWGRRNWRPAALALVLAMTAHLAYVMFCVPREMHRPMHFDLMHIAEYAIDRYRGAVLYAACGYPFADYLYRERPMASWTIVISTTIAFFGFMSVYLPRRRFKYVCLATALSLVWMAVHVLAGLKEDPLPSVGFFAKPVGLGTRFMFMPYCITLFAMCAAWDAMKLTRASWLKTGVRLACAMVVVTGIVSGPKNWPFQDQQWRKNVRAARAAGWDAEIPLNPPGWRLRLSPPPRP